ncbi:hypothetical protein N7510_000242 [Penicillium lagena]|uniref:uncharacterized protein n=1 Tax=Penicillium lagena TaxID=94218 RepID=UPI0025414E6C|nr:uncharacterized protein N7510_000242 [Penicillium lagena]KAJ5623933.1 hypothetical protein N7510_000242 [Penicillium lagena]
MLRLNKFVLILIIARTSTAWLLRYNATVEVDKLLWGGKTTSAAKVKLTGPITATPTSTVTSLHTDLIPATTNGGGRAEVNVTVEYLLFPKARLPVWTPTPSLNVWYPPTPTRYQEPTITTNYFAPYVISNPTSCTKTMFTYTDSIGVSLPNELMAQATDATAAMFVTTYISTVSTDLGGQAVTTTRCDVYLNAEAVPAHGYDLGSDGYFAEECVDPRRSTCSPGENQAATGSGGCKGLYPPTRAKEHSANTATSGASTTQTGGTNGTPTKDLLKAQTGLWSLIVYCGILLF